MCASLGTVTELHAWSSAAKWVDLMLLHVHIHLNFFLHDIDQHRACVKTGTLTLHGSELGLSVYQSVPVGEF